MSRPITKKKSVTPGEVRFTQISTGQYTDNLGHTTYRLIGLTADGTVYHYTHTSLGWEKFSMLEVVE